MTTAPRCSPFSPVRSTAARACSWLTSCGTARFAAARICSSMSRWARVQYRSCVRRPVDAAAVGGPHAQAGHVGEVRGGHLDDLGAGPPADGQLGHLGDHRLAVAAGWQHRERPVHFEPELRHRPDRMVALHLGDRDPRGGALGRVIQHRRCTPRRARRRTGRPARAPRTGRALHGARFVLPRRRAAAPRWVRRCRSARRWCGGRRP